MDKQEEMFGKYKIERRVSVNGNPAVTIYNTNSKSLVNSIVENWYFKTEGEREDFIQKFKDKINSWEQMKIQRRQERKDNGKVFLSQVKVGTILYDTWGYDQTNVEFYKVIRKSGSTVVVRELTHKTVPGSEGFMCCSVLPGESFIQDAPELKKIVRGSHVKINEVVSLRIWDGHEVYKSWYA